MSPSLSMAEPAPVIMITDVSAPHPKHCIDERQWRGLEKHNPFQLFDNDLKTAWIPCRYALKDEGYTINFDLKSPILVDELELIQVPAKLDAKAMNGGSQAVKRRRKREKGSSGLSSERPQRLERVQILFFNHEISTQYPVYYQDLLFEEGDRVRVKYDALLSWNPRLLGDSMFDERRRALELSPKGMKPPLTVHKFSLVFPRLDERKAPPALSELRLFFQGKSLKVSKLKESEDDYNDVMSRLYDLMLRDFMLIGETRAMIFSRTGTIWAMEGEEEKAKVIGGWRFHKNRVEVDLSPKQQVRVQAKRRARLEKKRDRYYAPIHLIVDEAPDRIFIVEGPLQGEYQAVKAPSPMSELDEGRDESVPSFEL